MKLSIIIPCKDRRENTEFLLKELLRQKKDYPQTEIIVVENGSTCDTSYLDNYNVICTHESITGVAHARNKGLELATGDYISFIDNDDWIATDYLETLYENIKTEKDWYVFQWSVDGRPVLMPDLDIKHPTKSNWALWGYCFKSGLIKAFKFDESKKAGEDLIIFDIITEKTEGHFIKKVLYHFKWEGNEDSLSHLYNKGLL